MLACRACHGFHDSDLVLDPIFLDLSGKLVCHEQANNARVDNECVLVLSRGGLLRLLGFLSRSRWTHLCFVFVNLRWAGLALLLLVVPVSLVFRPESMDEVWIRVDIRVSGGFQ